MIVTIAKRVGNKISATQFVTEEKINQIEQLLPELPSDAERIKEHSFPNKETLAKKLSGDLIFYNNKKEWFIKVKGNDSWFYKNSRKPLLPEPYKKGERLVVTEGKVAYIGTVSSIRGNSVYVLTDDGNKLSFSKNSKKILGRAKVKRIEKALPIDKALEQIVLSALNHKAFCIITKENKYFLIAKRKDGSWGLFGGNVDKGENYLQGVKRELKEEARLNITPKFYKEKNKVAWFIYDSPVIPKLNNEHTKFKWVGLTSMPSNLHYSIAKILKNLEKDYGK